MKNNRLETTVGGIIHAVLPEVTGEVYGHCLVNAGQDGVVRQ